MTKINRNKKAHYYSESESKPEDYYNYAYDKSDGKPLKKKRQM